MLQLRRVRGEEPEDHTFGRIFADFHFLIVALWRLRRAAALLAKIDIIKSDAAREIALFDARLPSLKILRDVAEHIDDYSFLQGKNRDVEWDQIEVYRLSENEFKWLGHTLNLEDTVFATNELFKGIQQIKLKLNSSAPL